MQEIPKTFKKNGLILTLAQRTAKLALYEARSPENKPRAWEVHKIRIMPPVIMKLGHIEKSLPEREVLAGNEQFGKYAWSYQHRENADRKYAELLQSNA